MVDNVAQLSEMPHPGDELNTPQNKVTTPPYVSFNTFRNLLDWLSSEGVPLRMDRSFWQSKFSGSTGTQLMAALRFLDLLTGEQPSSDLEGIVHAPADERRVILRELLKDAYTTVPFDELDRATPAMVRGWFGTYPVDGHTLRKSISFFVNAAREAQLPMSNAVRKMAKARAASATEGPREGGDARRVAAAGATAGGHTTGPPGRAASPDSDQALGTGHSTIRLESGGVVRLHLSVDLFQLSDRDRQFVLSLVDMARAYEDQAAERREAPPDTPGDSPG